MLSGVHIFCFAASYGVALALEITRLFFRSGIRTALVLGFGLAGVVAHTLFLIGRAQAGGTAPLSSSFDWYLMAAWVLAVVYLVISWQYPRAAVGVFTLPLVLALVAVAACWADRAPFPADRASLFWGTVHGVFLLLGTVAVLVGFATGLMYLAQAWRLKHKLPPRLGFQLPSLESLEHVNARAVLFSILLLATGLISGTILNLVNQHRQLTAIAWTDPIVVANAFTLAWLVAASGFIAFYKPARQGRKVAYLTIGSFVFLVFSLTVGLFFTEHRAVPHDAKPVARTGDHGTLSRGGTT
ncbi:MAG: hypothetical protein K1X74_02020 [Pirellulales bacterium]|nr:hypothetical protein [Pirellulales bacterium]